MSDSLPPSSTASTSPPASDATAPLLVPEDLHSLSSSSSDAEGGGHTSDWSSASPSENASDNEEEIEEFDLLASQELGQTPSDNSSNSNSSKSNTGRRMALSFPDPLESAEPLEAGPLSPSSCSNPSSSGKKVRADLENSILVDGGAYSLLLDAPTTQSPPLELKEEEETTSTPPPALQPQASPRTPFSRSSTIIRAKPTSISTKDAEEKVGKWRSTLTATSSSPSSPQTPVPSSPASSAILLSLPPSIESSQTLGGGEGGFSSVTSSQTVIQSTKPTSRATTPPLLSTEIDEKKPDSFEEKEKVNNLPRKLDELIEKSARGRGGVVGLKRWMSVLTVMGVVLAGIASFRLGDHLGAGSTSRIAATLTKSQISQEITPSLISATTTTSIIPIAIDSSTAITTTSVLQHALPTARPPNSLFSTPRESHPPRLPAPTLLHRLEAPPPPPSSSPIPAPHSSDLKERMLSHAARCIDLERRIEVQLLSPTTTGSKNSRRRRRRERKLSKRLKTRRRTLLSPLDDAVEDLERQMVFDHEEKERVIGWKEGFGNAWRFFKEDFEVVRERIKGGRKKGMRQVGFREGMGRAWGFFMEDVRDGYEMVRERFRNVEDGEEEKRMRVKFRIIEGLHGLPRPRLSRYPIVRDYVRSKSKILKKGIKEPSKKMGKWFKGIGKNVGSGPKDQALKLKERAKELVGFVKGQGGDWKSGAEFHVKRAARTVKWLEKKENWGVMRERRRVIKKREKREKQERKERKEKEKKRR